MAGGPPGGILQGTSRTGGRAVQGSQRAQDKRKSHFKEAQSHVAKKRAKVSLLDP